MLGDRTPRAIELDEKMLLGWWMECPAVELINYTVLRSEVA
jgi:hypothetical protein